MPYYRDEVNIGSPRTNITQYTSRLLPPGNLHNEGSVAANASAKSMRMPFSRPLKVGGNNENMPK
jgi:hypothetical protein